MQARHCPACDRELVQREGEDAYHFRSRKTCNRDCFANLAKRNGRAKVDAKGLLEQANVERRIAEVREMRRAEMEKLGCKFTDDLR
jgi:hypothetical protein